VFISFVNFFVGFVMVKYKNIVVWTLLLVFLPAMITAQAKNYFDEIGFKVIKSDRNELLLSYRPVIQRIDTIVTQNGSLTLLPVISGASLNEDNPGAPALLTLSVPLAVPGKDNFVLSSVSVKNILKLPNRIAPLPAFELKKDVWTEVYRIDEQKYSQIDDRSIVNLKYGGISRNFNIATLELTVAKFNPTLQSVEIPKEIIIRISFNGNSYTSSQQTDNSFDKTVINSNVADLWEIAPLRSNVLRKKSADKTLLLSNGDWIKLTVDKEGVYKIDAADLASLGFTIPKDLVNTIKVFGNGGTELSEKVSDAVNNKMNEQAIIVNTNTNGDLESIIFYGAPAMGFKYDGTKFVSWYNHYSDKNYYLLTWGGDDGKRVEAVNASGTVENNPITYTEKLFYKEELACALVGGSGRVWFGGSLFPRAFSNVLHNLDRTKEIFYRFNFAHRSGGNGTFSISESGKKILDVYIPLTADTKYLDARSRTGEISVPASTIPADDRSLLNITYQNSQIAGSTPFFNWYEIHYSRKFIPVDNKIDFWSDPGMEGITQFSVNNFSGQPLGFDVTEPGNPKYIENKAVTGGMFVFKYDLDGEPKHFFISASYDKPELSVTSFANLRESDSNAELILITHPSLMGSAKAYKSYRADRKIEIVNIQDVFNEFNAGLPDPTALRDFIAYVMINRTIKPKYILLWGDGHYDYKNIQTKVPSYIITYQSIENEDDYRATVSYTSDDYFARVIGDDRYCDVSISRMPIDSDKEGEWMVEKIKIYENLSSLDDWTTHLMMIADDSPTSNGNGDGATHTRQSETLSNKIVPEYMINKKIYLPEFPSENIPNGRRKPRVTEEIVSYTNTYGALTMNWVGHGNPRVWSHEEIFDRDKTIAQFKNLNRLFFNTAATCDFARWDMPETQSGAEALFLAKNGGSIGEFSSTRVVYSYDNAQINQTFYTEMFRRDAHTKRYQTLGEIMHAVKQIRANSNDVKYNLLADPMVRLLIPYYIVRVEKINSESVLNPEDTAHIQAMSKIDIVASVINPVDSTVVTDFNGYSNIMMLDADYGIIIEDIDGTKHSKLNYGGVLNRGSFPVENGKIKASFYIPEDISFINGPGRLYIYAVSDDKRRANGINRQFVISGVDSVEFEAQKPVINIYLDSTSFEPGDIVSSKPMLIVYVHDEYGINTSGSGIGHRLEAWIDDNPYSIDLTNDTYISPDDPKTLIARKLLSHLSPGEHTVRVRAWNVFNKYAVSETYFKVLSGDEGAMLWDATCYPNPFDNQVTLQFRHNLNLPFDATLRIYTSGGRMVKSIDTQISSVHTSEIVWDGTDFESRKVAQGMYILELEIRTYKGNARASTGVAFIR